MSVHYSWCCNLIFKHVCESVQKPTTFFFSCYPITSLIRWCDNLIKAFFSAATQLPLWQFDNSGCAVRMRVCPLLGGWHPRVAGRGPAARKPRLFSRRERGHHPPPAVSIQDPQIQNSHSHSKAPKIEIPRVSTGQHTAQTVDQVEEGGDHPLQIFTRRHWQSSLQMGSGRRNQKLTMKIQKILVTTFIYNQVNQTF